jgi:hypothetical protein
MSQQTQHSSANLLQQISKQRGAGSPFTSHAGVSIYAHPDVTPKPSDKRVSRRANPTTKPAASKKANEPIIEDNCSNELFIFAPAPKDGLPRYCAQIRRRTNDGPINRWSDLNVMDRKILVRDMKHPHKKKGNNVWVKLTPQALKIILSMPRTSEFIFPYNPKSVGAAFRRHRRHVKIDDLRFHDLRHEGISRLCKMTSSTRTASCAIRT